MKITVKIYNFVIVNALCLLLLNCEAPQEDSPLIDEGISKTNEAFMSALTNGDAAGVAAQYTDDAQLLPPNADLVTGKQEIQNAMQGFIDSGVTSLTLESTEIEGIGNKAYEVGKYTLTVGEQVVDNGKYIVIWKKDGEQWKLHRDIFNSSMPLPEVDDSEGEGEGEGEGDDDEEDDN